MKEKVWNAEFEGQQLRAIWKHSWSDRKFWLEIDGNATEIKVINAFDIYQPNFISYDFDGVVREIEVRFASGFAGWGMGCQILIDDRLVCGDQSIRYLDPKITEQQFNKGFIHCFLTVGLCRYGLLLAIVGTIADMISSRLFFRNKTIESLPETFMWSLIIFSIIMTRMYWCELRICVNARKKVYD